MDRRLSNLLARQHSVVARWQAVAEGVPCSVYDGHVERGRLVAVEHGVHRSVDVRLTTKGRAMAVALRCGPRALVTGPLVLHWLGVTTVALDAPWGVLLPIDVSRPKLRTNVQVWRASGPLGRMVRVDGIPCACAARSVLESSRVLPELDWLGLADQCAWRGRPSRLVLAREFSGLPAGSPVARRAKPWLQKLSTGEESPGERRMFAAAGDLGTSFERQAWVHPSVRADGLDRETSTILEYLGKDHHHAGTRGPDSSRDRIMRESGYLPVYVTEGDLRHPAAFRARLATAIARGTTSPNPAVA